ncbi:MAG: HAMP domain-containing histidine kinase [Bryobacteraceae bacterium]|nr:HAMP domain-containing histidine kinase [Bryobacteraceae bacterium]
MLHNLFFLTLASAVYFTLIPPFERRVMNARAIEISLVTEIFSSDKPPARLQRIEAYNYREGTASQIAASPEIQSWLDQHPGEMSTRDDVLYRKDARTGFYRRLNLPTTVYDEVIDKARRTLFVVLGLVYVLAVGVLEFVIMPAYVYGPIRLMLDADRATRQGDRENELIEPDYITRDEIGRIMESRNETVKELRRQEDELAEALSQLEAQDRLASLGLLSASVAHEMNTPLAVLHGSIEKLLETPCDPHTRERLERMQRVSQRLRTISEGLVDFARVRQVTMERVALRQLINEAWDLVSIDDRASQVNFENEVVETAGVIGNGDRLVQVFVNLLRNALESVSAGGHVEVRCRRTDRDGKKWIATMVEDDGPGIPRDVLPNLFDAFVSSRLDSRGTGLGLTVAAGIVQQHEGQIHASNRPGGGARLEVLLRSAD